MSRQLWVAVLASGLMDAARGDDESWIGSHDFRIVCDFCDLPADVVAFRFREHRLALQEVIAMKPKRRPRPKKIVSARERREARQAKWRDQRAQERA